MMSALNPAPIRSETRSLGDRLRDRLRISSWCLRSTDSATTERAPPGPASRATAARRCRTRTAKSLTAHRSKIATSQKLHANLQFATDKDQPIPLGSSASESLHGLSFRGSLQYDSPRSATA